jgi:pimeloyl-ACP methyl ester carboxylesterase
MQLQPFKINVAQHVLDDLKTRLQNTRWTDEVPGAGWHYGTNSTYLKDLVDYWQHQFDWKAQEKKLNTFQHFRTQIDEVGIHFIHERGKGPNPTPLLLVHGWPDSFFRFYKIIPMLTDPASFGGDPADAFDVIVPSLPGFGFSDKYATNADRTAGLFSTLMTDVLGYKNYLAAGGDMGTNIVKSLALNYPHAVQAIHLTDVGYPNGTEDWSTMSPAEQEFGQVIQQWWFTEGAYNMIQSTKPQTLGYGLNDSPVGLASWIIEKFYTWSDCKGDLESRFTKDELLTNITIYWVTETINTSIRTYLENARAVYAQPGGPKPAQRSEVPAALASFPAEAPVPREWAERMVNLQRFNKMSSGGHFAALEEPELLVKDMREFFRGFRKQA